MNGEFERRQLDLFNWAINDLQLKFNILFKPWVWEPSAVGSHATPLTLLNESARFTEIFAIANEYIRDSDLRQERVAAAERLADLAEQIREKALPHVRSYLIEELKKIERRLPVLTEELNRIKEAFFSADGAKEGDLRLEARLVWEEAHQLVDGWTRVKSQVRQTLYVDSDEQAYENCGLPAENRLNAREVEARVLAIAAQSDALLIRTGLLIPASPDIASLCEKAKAGLTSIGGRLEQLVSKAAEGRPLRAELSSVEQDLQAYCRFFEVQLADAYRIVRTRALLHGVPVEVQQNDIAARDEFMAGQIGEPGLAARISEVRQIAAQVRARLEEVSQPSISHRQGKLPSVGGLLERLSGRRNKAPRNARGA